MESNKIIKCYICNLEISKTNWSKHIKTKKHLNNISKPHDDDIKKHCGICNISKLIINFLDL